MAFTIVPIDGWTTQSDMNLRGLVVRVHVAVFRTYSDVQVSPYIAEQAVAIQEGISQFSVFTDDPWARVRKISTSQDHMKKNPFVYTTTVEWSTEAPDSNQQNREEDNPLDDQPEIDLDGETILYPMFKDLTNVLIANKANQAIVGVDEERSIEVLTITRNEADRNYVRDRYYRGTVNADTYLGADPGTMKMRSIRSSRQYRNAILFWKYTYVIAYNDKGWQPKVLNAGTKQKIPAGGSFSATRIVDCVDDNGVAVSDPVPLDTNGLQIPAASLPSAANYLTFTTLNSTSFADLGLPTS